MNFSNELPEQPHEITVDVVGTSPITMQLTSKAVEYLMLDQKEVTTSKMDWWKQFISDWKEAFQEAVELGDNDEDLEMVSYTIVDRLLGMHKYSDFLADRKETMSAACWLYKHFDELQLNDDDQVIALAGAEYFFINTTPYVDLDVDPGELSNDDIVCIYLYYLYSLMQVGSVASNSNRHEQSLQYLRREALFRIVGIELDDQPGLLSETESKVLDIAGKHPSLRDQVKEVLADIVWAREENDVLYSSAPHADADVPLRIQSEAGFVRGNVDHIMRDKEKAEELFEHLSIINSALDPEGKPLQEEVWDDPLKACLDVCKDKRLVYMCIYPPEYYDHISEQTLRNAHDFSLAALEGLSQNGFKHWILDKQAALEDIELWLHKNRELEVMDPLSDLVMQYQQDFSSKKTLRTHLCLPSAAEPSNVTVAIQYLQQILDVAKQHGVSVIFNSDQAPSDAEPLLKLMPANARIVDSHKLPKDIAFIDHRYARPYDQENFHFTHAFSAAAFHIGEKRGWGSHQTSAVNINGNQEFNAFVAARKKENIGYTMLWEDLHGYKDLFIFTTINDADEEDVYVAEDSPVETLPLVPVG